MCTRYSAVVLPVAALLVMANIETPALAKPPDLPKNQKIICTPPANQAPAGSLLFGVGVSSDGGFTGNILLVQKSENSGYLSDFLKHCWQDLLEHFTGGSGIISVELIGEMSRGQPAPVELIPVMPAKSLPSMPVEAEPRGREGSRTPSAEVTCPYLRQKAAQSTEEAAETNIPSASVGENLEKLEHAQQYYREAEYYRRHGCSNVARSLYEEIRKLCPGSRYDRQAAARLRRLEAQKTAEVTHFANEEQELSPPPETTSPDQDDRETLPLPNSEASPQKNGPGEKWSQGSCTIRLGQVCLTLGLNQQNGRGSLLYGLGLASDGAAILQAAWQVLEDPVAKWIGALNESGWSGDFSGAHY